ncbi:hypothetical protein [Halorubrum halodurans]|uniref:TFIIS-type domain-containing protein n=1 Tax=Halorubrum halodurans TaxID=1383851 RepID=A0A256IJI2_9EURY|nr:hypothetical protein [Halorubrum halodurans]OYR56674.1 hypothetical protein DJ70_08130 [Halorubrum halodurans]
MTRAAQTSIAAFATETDTTPETPGDLAADNADTTNTEPVEIESDWDGDIDVLFDDDGSLKPAGEVDEPVTFTTEQEDTEDKLSHVDPINNDDNDDDTNADTDADTTNTDGDDNNTDADTETCPKCGRDNIEIRWIVQQTRAADESGTEIGKTTCGCTIRRAD